MGFGDFMTSTSQATDSRIAGTDQARITKGNVGQSVETGAVGLTGMSTLLGAGATQTTVKTKGKNNSVTVVNADPAVAQAAINQITGLAGQFGQSLEDFMTNSNANALQLAAINAAALQTTQDSLLASQNQQDALEQTGFTGILDKFAALLSNQQPAGDTLKNNIALYVMLGALALVGFIFYFKRK